ncbi:MAG: FMN-binding protein, partial [Lentisphaeria bacterium]
MPKLVKNIFVVIIIASTCGFILSLVNKQLANKFLQNSQKYMCEQILLAINTESSEPIMKVRELFKSALIDGKDVTIDNFLALRVTPQHFLLRPFAENLVVIGMTGSGLWGPIRAIMATDLEFEKIIGFTIVEMNETPGLGSQYKEREFLQNLIGKNPRKVAIINRGKKVEIDDLDGITGATYTGKAIELMIKSST